MSKKNQPPLWARVCQHETLSKLDTDVVGQFALVVAKYLEDAYGPTIHTWCLRSEAEHAFRVRRDLMRSRVSQHSAQVASDAS